MSEKDKAHESMKQHIAGLENQIREENMKCEKCNEKIKKENFWNHPHDDYTTIDYTKHYEDTKQ